MSIIIGSDHAGFELKSFFKIYLNTLNYDIVDIGTFSSDSCDYPDIAKNLSLKMNENKNNIGILICGTGVGMSISINRYPFIRGALLYNKEETILAKEHNDANVAIFAGRMFDKEYNLEMLKLFLETKFSNEERHKKRINKLSCEM